LRRPFFTPALTFLLTLFSLFLVLLAALLAAAAPALGIGESSERGHDCHGHCELFKETSVHQIPFQLTVRWGGMGRR
jgi:hypothetical protein